MNYFTPDGLLIAPKTTAKLQYRQTSKRMKFLKT